MTNDKEEQLIVRRFKDLAYMAETRYMNTFTGFLGMQELSLFLEHKKQYSNVSYSVFGGLMDSERKMVCFHGMEDSMNSSLYERKGLELILTQEAYQQYYPIRCIHIVPLNKKFSDTLTHRDFLGAILNLGIDRSKVGDILLQENEAYVFCEDTISDFIVMQLTKIKHTNVKLTQVEFESLNIERKYIELSGTVSSIRLDSIISTAFKTSRSSLTGFIAGGKVFVNGRQTEQNSYVPKDHDVISVRGLGKFEYIGTTNQTKKGRYSIRIKRYN